MQASGNSYIVKVRLRHSHLTCPLTAGISRTRKPPRSARVKSTFVFIKANPKAAASQGIWAREVVIENDAVIDGIQNKERSPLFIRIWARAVEKLSHGKRKLANTLVLTVYPGESFNVPHSSFTGNHKKVIHRSVVRTVEWMTGR